ncbi:MAG: relaxase/mobilization nuclease domain-containing protein [Acidaminococcaceae bacterium]|nr:relaxase/mobilization nuclease domain-containing protein [Acidaminococcaceae bacterium]
MATTRLMALHVGKGRSVGTAISDIIDYVENPEKTDKGQLITSYGCNARIADKEFLFAKRLYIQKTGRVRGADDVIAYHLRQSFVPGEITPEEANRMGRELAMRFTKGKNAFVVCTHIDKAHVHNHIIFSAVNLDCDRKFRDFLGSGRALGRISDTLCIENGYSIVETPRHKGKSYNKWLGDDAPVSHCERLCYVIDEALKQHPESFEALLELLRQAGYEIKGNPANPSLRGGEQKRFVRMDTLGPGYSAAELKAVIAGERQHTPKQRKAKAQKQPRRTNQLLIDIQAKLAQGKGAGYANWAKKFNLKQMAKTVAYLQDHDLMNYAALTEQTDAATARYRELSDKIKAAETRMAEIAVLRTQIINYIKTRDTYVAYRKAGYSKKFRAEHEADILLHKAAKEHFDSLGLKKLPTVKALNAEYAALLAEKKAAYADYRQAKDDMRELLTTKANIDRILGKEPEARNAQQEKETEQR